MTISDINAEIRALTDTDSTSYTNADLLRRVNAAYETVVAWILEFDGRWEFDDTNYSDQPRGVGTLVEGQEAYSFASEYLDIEAIEVLSTGSPAKFRRLKPLNHDDLNGLSPEEYFGLESNGDPKKGTPEYYDKEGDTIRIYPAPGASYVTLASGLQIWFKRTADLFTSAQVTTGTKEPGFASPFHIVLCYMAAIPYCMAYKKDRVALYEAKVQQLKRDMEQFYSKRGLDDRPVMTMNEVTYI